MEKQYFPVIVNISVYISLAKTKSLIYKGNKEYFLLVGNNMSNLWRMGECVLGGTKKYWPQTAN